MRNVLITGASRGIGKACVYEFIKSGNRVFLNYNQSDEAAEKIAAETGAILIKADISKSEDVKKMKEIVSGYGSLDVLINNAGISQIKMFTDITENDWDKMFNVNVKGMYNVTHEFIGDMISAKKGKIINISSMWGVTGGSCEVHYSAAKAAVIGFTKSLAKEMGPSNINVNCIAPGVIETDMNAHLTDEDIEELKNETPLMRTGTPGDVARTALFLASEDANFITGQVINVDGGMVI